MEWKEIPSLPGMFASDTGMIGKQFGDDIVEIGSFAYNTGGKYRAISVNGNVRQVHRLVLEAFVGPCPPGQQCRHLNDIPSDNRLENLRWGTPKENGEDRVRNGGAVWGEDHHKAIHTEDDVIEMRRLWNAGLSLPDLAKRFNTNRTTVHAAVTGRNWPHIKCDDPSAQPGPKPLKTLTAFGETKTLREWIADPRCQLLRPGNIPQRLKAGMTPEDAISAPARLTYTAFGETKTVPEWASDPRCVVTASTLNQRIRDGVDVETAITSSWCNVAAKKKSPDCSPDVVRDIRDRLARGERGVDIAVIYGLSKSTISLIRRGKSHTNVK